MQKQTILKHGISENGELQVYRVDQIVDDTGKVLTEKAYPPYSPKNTKNMEGFDTKSIEIIKAIMASEVLVAFAKESFNALKAHVENVEVTGDDYNLQEVVTYDRMVDDLGRIAVRRITRYYDEGVEIGKKYHRSWIMPGDDPNGADVISKALALKLHTPEAIAVYKDKMVELSKI